MTTPDDVIKVASQYIGYRENPAGSNICPPFTDYGFPGKWCAMFVSYVFNKAGMPLNMGKMRGGAGTTSVDVILSYAKSTGRFGTQPRKGAVVIFDWKGGVTDNDVAQHTGICVGFTATHLTSIDGNTTGGSDNVSANGGKVARVTRSLKSVHGFYYPMYDGDSSLTFCGDNTTLASSVQTVDPVAVGVSADWAIRYATTNKANATIRKAFLDMWSAAEGTNHGGQGGYDILYTSTAANPKRFTSYAKHPNTVLGPPSLRPTAAGRYQFLFTTWEEHRKALNLPDFGPASQDRAILRDMKGRGVLKYLDDGDIRGAIQATGELFASNPYSKTNQPHRTLDWMLKTYNAAAGANAKVAEGSAVSGSRAASVASAKSPVRNMTVRYSKKRDVGALKPTGIIVSISNDAPSVSLTDIFNQRFANSNTEGGHFLVGTADSLKMANEDDGVMGLNATQRKTNLHIILHWKSGSDYSTQAGQQTLQAAAAIASDMMLKYGIKDTAVSVIEGVPRDQLLKYINMVTSVTYTSPSTGETTVGCAEQPPPKQPMKRTLALYNPLMKGDDVTALQILVGAKVTGAFGLQTQLKVFEWQKANNLKANGVFDKISGLKADWNILY